MSCCLSLLQVSLLGIVLIWRDDAGEIQRFNMGLHSLDRDQNSEAVQAAVRLVGRKVREAVAGVAGAVAFPPQLLERFRKRTIDNLHIWVDCSSGQFENADSIAYLAGFMNAAGMMNGGIRIDWADLLKEVVGGIPISFNFFGECHGKSWVDTFFGWVTAEYTRLGRIAKLPITREVLFEKLEEKFGAASASVVTCAFLPFDHFRSSSHRAVARLQHVDHFHYHQSGGAAGMAGTSSAFSSVSSTQFAATVAHETAKEAAVRMEGARPPRNENQLLNDLTAHAHAALRRAPPLILEKCYELALFNGLIMIHSHPPEFIPVPTAGKKSACLYVPDVIADLRYLIGDPRYDGIRDLPATHVLKGEPTTIYRWLQRLALCESARSASSSQASAAVRGGGGAAAAAGGSSSSSSSSSSSASRKRPDPPTAASGASGGGKRRRHNSAGGGGGGDADSAAGRTSASSMSASDLLAFATQSLSFSLTRAPSAASPPPLHAPHPPAPPPFSFFFSLAPF